MLWRQKRAVLFLLAACIATASDKPAAKTANRAPAGHSMARKMTVIGVSNFGEVTPHLYRGGQPKRAGYQHLKQMGIDIVVDVRLSGEDTEKQDVTKAGMRYVSMPWHCLFPKDQVFAEFLKLLLDNPNKKVFVHCRYGDDRTGMMIAAYRMGVEGWTPKDARKEMKKFGFNRMVCPSLVHYEKKFPDHLKNSSAFRDLRPHLAGSESH
jgi:tyrosine-protein phosphatase SIW14